MVMNWGGGLLMFFEPLCKGSCRFSNIFFLTPIFIAFVPVYDSTFVGKSILVLWSHQEAFDGLTSLIAGSIGIDVKSAQQTGYNISLMVITSPSTTYFLQVFFILSLSPCWYGTTIYKFLLLRVGLTSFAVVVSGCTSVWVLAFQFCPIHGPCGVFAFFEGFAEMVFFLLQQL